MKNQTLAILVMALMVLPLASAFSISGTVTDNYGNAVSGATVTCFNVTTEANFNTTTTDAAGEYTFANVNELEINAGIYTCNATITYSGTRTTKANTGENVTVVDADVTRDIALDEMTYTAEHDSEDVAPITIDFLGLVGAEWVGLVAVIALVMLGAWGAVKYKKMRINV